MRFRSPFTSFVTLKTACQETDQTTVVDLELLELSLEVIGSLAEALGDNFASIMSQSPTLVTAVVACVKVLYYSN